MDRILIASQKTERGSGSPKMNCALRTTAPLLRVAATLNCSQRLSDFKTHQSHPETLWKHRRLDLMSTVSSLTRVNGGPIIRSIN